MKALRATITAVALAVALVHLLFPDIHIDAITVTLLAIAVVPWLGTLFKAIELPGGVKVEYQELVRVEQEAQDAGLLAGSAGKRRESRHVYAFEALLGSDPRLVLSALRTSLEGKLKELAQSRSGAQSAGCLGS